MGEFRSGVWIVLLLFYFFLLFGILTSVVNAKAEVGYHETRVTVNDPGFQTSAGFNADGCSGKPGVLNVFNNYRCERIDVINQAECLNISGCSWKNATNLFNITISPEECEGNLNTTFYGLDGTTRSNACETITDANVCDLIKCEWTNITSQIAEPIDLEKPSLTTVWQTIKWVATFNADLGLGGFTFYFSFLAFWIPLVMLLWALYMAAPFLH